MNSKKRYAVLISYLGTRYCGWQVQRAGGEGKNGEASSGHALSIQEVCETTLEKMIGMRVHWQASGRTDAGVHAMGQVAHFTVDWNSPPRAGKAELQLHQLLRGMNTLLPSDIRILEVKEAPEDFHAQKDAEKKQYSYYFQVGRAPTAFHHLRTAFHHEKLDVAAMHEAIRHLVGEHDFKPFQGSGSNPMKSTVRTIYEAEVTELRPEGPFPIPLDSLTMIRIRVVGSGFLRYMVRGIAGTLFEIGSGKRPPSDMVEILRTKDRARVGQTAAPEGLWLERVWYPNLSF